MYLTRMWINPRRRKTPLMLTNRQMMHAAVESAFSPEAHDSEQATRPLWRIDRDGDRIALYILSPQRPSLAHLQEQVGWEEEKTWATMDYAPLLRQIQKGDRYAFRLAANPVRIVTENGKKKRCHHVTVAQQLQWLLDRAAQMGVEFAPLAPDKSSDGNPEPSVKVTNRQLSRFKRRNSHISLSVVQFDGLLTVTDPEKLRGILTDGLGRGKAYGCGLLTLAPIDTKV